MTKQINMSARPKQNKNVDTWVETRSNLPPPPPKPKRLTVDMDPTQHNRLKTHCAKIDVPISELMRSLVDQVLDDAVADSNESSAA